LFLASDVSFPVLNCLDVTSPVLGFLALPWFFHPLPVLSPFPGGDSRRSVLLVDFSPGRAGLPLLLGFCGCVRFCLPPVSSLSQQVQRLLRTIFCSAPDLISTAGRFPRFDFWRHFPVPLSRACCQFLFPELPSRSSHPPDSFLLPLFVGHATGRPGDFLRRCALR
jgi:hypothetical protein